jgi:hypothetical protein
LSKKKTQPISIRLNFRERKLLEKLAGKTPLSSYIRNRLFSHTDCITKDDKNQLAQILGLLGQSNIASNLRELTSLARTGSLFLTPEITSKLEQACNDISEIKSMIMKALRIKED